jgi:predicted nucleic acid-binding protein
VTPEKVLLDTDVVIELLKKTPSFVLNALVSLEYMPMTLAKLSKVFR